MAILAILVAAYGYDMFVAAPGVKSADELLRSEAMKNNEVGFDPNLSGEEKQKRIAESIFDEKDVQRVLRKSPASVVEKDGYTIEYYRWWGYVPLKRHYMAVVYNGKAPNLKYNTHVVGDPPPDILPGFVRETEDDPLAVSPQGLSTSPNGPPIGGGGQGDGSGGSKGDGKGGGKGRKGKGGGLPPPGADPAAQPDGETEPQPAKSNDSPADAPKNDPSTQKESKEGIEKESKGTEQEPKEKDGEAAEEPKAE